MDGLLNMYVYRRNLARHDVLEDFSGGLLWLVLLLDYFWRVFFLGEGCGGAEDVWHVVEYSPRRKCFCSCQQDSRFRLWSFDVQRLEGCSLFRTGLKKVFVWGSSWLYIDRLL